MTYKNLCAKNALNKKQQKMFVCLDTVDKLTNQCKVDCVTGSFTCTVDELVKQIKDGRIYILKGISKLKTCLVKREVI